MVNDFNELLEKAVNGKLENYEVQNHAANEKGEGFQSEMVFISLKNKETAEEYHFVIKKRFSNCEENGLKIMEDYFFNEIYYYTKVFPAFQNFQSLYPGVAIFDNFAKCFAINSEKGNEKMVLENLKYSNYEIHPKIVPFDSNSMESIFRMYARFHAISFAMKYNQPDLFSELSAPVRNTWLTGTDFAGFKNILKHFSKKILGYLLDEGEEQIVRKFQKYVDNGVEILTKKLQMKSSYPVFLHGDCWSNNMMFKYNASREIEDIKLIDFQVGLVSSLVLDLSYTFYAGASKETLDNFDNLLKAYYQELSETLKQYQCDVKTIISYEDLKREYKQYCSHGLFLSIVIWVLKTAKDLSEMAGVDEMFDNKVKLTEENNFGMKFDEKMYREVTLHLVRHMYNNDLL